MADSHNTTNVLPERLANYAAAIDRTHPLKPIGKKRFPTLKHKPGFVYLLKGADGYYKIGCTAKPDQRIQKLAGHQMPFEVSMIHLIPTDDCLWAETYLHGLFAKRHVHGEWYKLTEEDVERICTIKEMLEGFDLVEVAA